MADEIKEREGDEGSLAETSPGLGYEPEKLSEVAVSSSDERYLGDIVGGKYRVDRKIGQGGMGEVYLGINDELGQKVAIKFLNRKFVDDEGIVQRFLNEARSYCRVTHPNAVTLLEYGQHDDGTLYITTEFVEGKSLSATMQDEGPFEVSRILPIAIQLCEVLAAAHEQNVIHRDLKPDNLMLTPTSRGKFSLKVLDFGIAKIIDDEEDGPTTETGSVFGTPEFMSPEQARGEVASPRSDIYAAGLILYYMASGKLPFRGKNKLVVLNKQLNEDPAPPRTHVPSIPVRFEAVIMKCLNKNPDGRYATADDLHDALEDLALPPGSNTAKFKGLSEASEVPEPGDTPDALRVGTVRLGEWALEADGHADTLASDLDEVSLGDLESIEMWREQPATAKQKDVRPAGVRHAKVAAGFVVVAALAVVGFYIMSSNNEAAEVDVQRLLVTGQVVGLLTAVDDMIRDGNLTGAERALKQTEVWMPSAEIDDSAGEQRERLRETVKSLEDTRDQVERASVAGRCDEAIGLAESVREQSPGLASRLKKHVEDECRRVSDKGSQKGESVVGSAKSEKARVQPVVAETADETEDSVESSTPAPADRAPVDEAPEVSPTEESGAVEPQGELELEDETPEAGTELPEGMALPPKTVE